MNLKLGESGARQQPQQKKKTNFFETPIFSEYKISIKKGNITASFTIILLDEPRQATARVVAFKIVALVSRLTRIFCAFIDIYIMNTGSKKKNLCTRENLYFPPKLDFRCIQGYKCNDDVRALVHQRKWSCCRNGIYIRENLS